MQRREVLKAGLAASLAGAFPAATPWAQSRTAVGACVLTVDGDDGPFYFDSHLVRSDITEGRRGLPLELTMRIVTSPDCSPITNARADLWQADALGTYSGYDSAEQADARGETFLRGHQPTNTAGEATFNTIYPGWYPGRTPHIHLKVILASNELLTSQLYFPDELSDRVYRAAPYLKAGTRLNNGNDGIARQQGRSGLASVSPEGNGYLVKLLVGVDPRGSRGRR